MNLPTVWIGIDPGVNTGLAIYSSVTEKLELFTKGPEEVRATLRTMAQENDKRLKNGAEGAVFFKVRLEDPRLNKPTFKRQGQSPAVMDKIAQNVGSNKRDAGLMEDLCRELHMEVELIKPNSAKWDAAMLKAATGYAGRTSEHARDAAKLIADKVKKQVEGAKPKKAKAKREPKGEIIDLDNVEQPKPEEGLVAPPPAPEVVAEPTPEVESPKAASSELMDERQWRKGAKLTKTLMEAITPDRAVDLMHEQAEEYNELMRLKSAKSQSNAGFSVKIKKSEEKLEKLAKAVEQGTEEIPVECQWMLDYTNGVKRLIRLDTQDVIEYGTLDEKERQMKLQLEEEQHLDDAEVAPQSHRDNLIMECTNVGFVCNGKLRELYAVTRFFTNAELQPRPDGWRYDPTPQLVNQLDIEQLEQLLAFYRSIPAEDITDWQKSAVIPMVVEFHWLVSNDEPQELAMPGRGFSNADVEIKSLFLALHRKGLRPEWEQVNSWSVGVVEQVQQWVEQGGDAPEALSGLLKIEGQNPDNNAEASATEEQAVEPNPESTSERDKLIADCARKALKLPTALMLLYSYDSINDLTGLNYPYRPAGWPYNPSAAVLSTWDDDELEDFWYMLGSIEAAHADGDVSNWTTLLPEGMIPRWGEDALNRYWLNADDNGVMPDAPSVETAAEELVEDGGGSINVLRRELTSVIEDLSKKKGGEG